MGLIPTNDHLFQNDLSLQNNRTSSEKAIALTFLLFRFYGRGEGGKPNFLRQSSSYRAYPQFSADLTCPTVISLAPLR